MHGAGWVVAAVGAVAALPRGTTEQRKVERGFIEDGFNLYGLRQYVTNFNECLDVILDRVGES